MELSNGELWFLIVHLELRNTQNVLETTGVSSESDQNLERTFFIGFDLSYSNFLIDIEYFTVNKTYSLLYLHDSDIQIVEELFDVYWLFFAFYYD